MLVEAAVESLEQALAAERAGVDRIELCANLEVGGITPSTQLIAAVIAQVKRPVFVMIRPRGGDFVYAADDIDAMIEDIDRARPLGIAGIVTGALRSDGTVDVDSLRRLMSPAAGLPVTFHKAFDVTANLPSALEQVIELGATRLLTSGGAATAVEGAAMIAELVEQAGERILIVAGGKIRENNARDVIAHTRVREVHARFEDESSMRRLVSVVKDGASVAGVVRKVSSVVGSVKGEAGVARGMTATPSATPGRTKFEGAEPILSVKDMAASIRYYVDVLGFRNADWGDGKFTSVNRDGAGIYLCQGGQGTPGTWVWVGVEDVAVLYEEYKASGAKIRGKPENFPWAYEMKIEDPDGHVLRFGSEPRGDQPLVK